jgi:hypothetical protein
MKLDVRETLSGHKDLSYKDASAHWQRTVPADGSGCKAYTLRWRLADKFYGVGWYTVQVRLLDADGATSAVVTRRLLTVD